MECRRFQRLIYLYRTGEISEREAADLADHLRSCPRCPEVVQQIPAYDDVLRRLRERHPQMHQPDEFVDAVLGRIHRALPAQLTPPHREPAGWLPDLVFSPAFRFALAGIVITTIGLLAFQWIGILRDVQGLETKMALHIGESRGPDVAYTVSNAPGRTNPVLGDLKHLLTPDGVKMEDGSFIVLEKTLRQFAAGMPGGPGDAVRLASVFGGDRRKIDAMVRYLERHVTPTLIF